MQENIEQYLHASDYVHSDMATRESHRNLLLQVIRKVYPSADHVAILTAIEQMVQKDGITTEYQGQVTDSVEVTNSPEVEHNQVEVEPDAVDFVAITDAYFIQVAPVLLAKCNEIMHGLLTDPDAPIKYSDRASNWAIDLLADLWPLQLSLVPVGTDQVLKYIDFSFRSYMQQPLHSKYFSSVLYVWFDDLCMQWIQQLPTPLSDNFEILYDTLRNHHHPDYHEWCMHDDYCVILFQKFTSTNVHMTSSLWSMLFDSHVTNLTMFERSWLRKFSKAGRTKLEWQSPELLVGLRRLLLHGIAIEVSMSWPSFWQVLHEIFALALKSDEALFTIECEQRWNEWLYQCTIVEKQFMRLWLVEWLRIESGRIHSILGRYLPQSNVEQVIAAILNLAAGLNISYQLWDVAQQLRQQQRDDRLKRGESAELLPAFQKSHNSLCTAAANCTSIS